MRTSDKGTAPKDPEQVRVGNTIRAFRERFGFTQDQLATECAMSQGHLANIEAGRKHLGNRHLALIAKALELTPLAIKRPDAELLELVAA